YSLACSIVSTLLSSHSLRTASIKFIALPLITSLAPATLIAATTNSSLYFSDNSTNISFCTRFVNIHNSSQARNTFVVRGKSLLLFSSFSSFSTTAVLSFSYLSFTLLCVLLSSVTTDVPEFPSSETDVSLILSS